MNQRSSRAAPRLVPVTVLFADITGSTTMYAERGDEAAYDATSKCLRFLEQEAIRHGRKLIRSVGDGVLCVFDDAARALTYAVSVCESNDPIAQELREAGVKVRFGINRGFGILEESDVYGDCVNVAARLVDRAVGEEILISGSVYDEIAAHQRSHVRFVGELFLRNRPKPVLVYQYLCVVDDATATHAANVRTCVSPRLELRRGDCLHLMEGEGQILKIGRARECDFAIEDEVISREHAIVTCRGNRFVLKDLSRNGTRVRFDSGDVVLLNREEIALVGSGEILVASDESEGIAFRVVPGSDSP